jgi:hypothetical protein
VYVGTCIPIYMTSCHIRQKSSLSLVRLKMSWEVCQRKCRLPNVFCNIVFATVVLYPETVWIPSLPLLRSFKHSIKQATICLLHVSPTCTSWISCFTCYAMLSCDSAVGIATRYGLNGPGIESLQRRDFPHSFRLSLASTQPHTVGTESLSRGVKRPGRGVDHTPHSKRWT